MTDNIISKNQKGGITAGTVNIGSDKPKIKNIWSNRWFKYMIIPIIGIVIGGLILSNINMRNGEEKKGDTYVTSFNQEGGITAGAVNIGAQPRKLTPELISQLKDLLPSDKEKTIRVTSVLGDQEAFQFATEIKQYLESEGWKVDGINQAIFDSPIIGQTITPNGEEITIGSKN